MRRKIKRSTRLFAGVVDIKINLADFRIFFESADYKSFMLQACLEWRTKQEKISPIRKGTCKTDAPFLKKLKRFLGPSGLSP